MDHTDVKRIKHLIMMTINSDCSNDLGSLVLLKFKCAISYLKYNESARCFQKTRPLKSEF